MSFSLTNRGIAGQVYSSSDLVVSAFTPAANSVLLAVVIGKPTLVVNGVSGHGTWSQIDSITDFAANHDVSIWACSVGASPSSSAVTVDINYAEKSVVAVYEIGDSVAATPVSDVFGVKGSDYGYVSTENLEVTLASFASAANMTLAIGAVLTGSHNFVWPDGTFTTTAVQSAQLISLQAAWLGSEDNSVVLNPNDYMNCLLWAVEVKETGGGAAPTITDAGDESYAAGETGITITGTNFGASQGSGSVKISPTDNVADSNAVTQTVTAWSDTSITFTCVRGSLALNTNLYLFVTSDGAYSNASGHVVQIAGTRKLKLLIEAAAVGATVDGIVWAKAAGQIAGAEIGEFTGATIAAGTGADSGYAVLKVPVADFGGGALNVNDTVLCYVKNATNFSAPWDATIIEE